MVEKSEVCSVLMMLKTGLDILVVTIKRGKLVRQVVRQRIWVRSATGNERLFSNNVIQVLMNTMKETFA